MKNFRFLLIVFFICVFCFVANHLTAADMVNKKVIIIPQFQKYLAGYESDYNRCNECKPPYSKNKKLNRHCKTNCEELKNCQILSSYTDFQLYSDLGKTIYYNMIEGITLFNRKANENNKNIVFQLNTQKVPIVNCKSNKIIRKFYDEVVRDNSRLRKNLRKRKSETFIWVEKDPEFNTEVANCMQYTKCYNREIPITLTLFDRTQKKSKQLKLKFKKNYMTFSLKSLEELKNSVCWLLYESRFPTPVEEQKKDESSTNQ